MTFPLPVLSPISILPPPSSHCASIAARKNTARVSKSLVHIFPLLYLLVGRDSISRYRDSLCAGPSRDRNPVGARFSAPVQTGPGAHPTCYTMGRVQLKRDGTRWRTGGEVKGKLTNGVGSQYHPLPRNLVYPALQPLMRTPRLSVVDWTDAPTDLNGLVRFAERQTLVSARVPSHFKRSLQGLSRG